MGVRLRIEKFFPRVIVRHHEACGVMPNDDPERQIFHLYRTSMMDSFSCIRFDFQTLTLIIAYALMPEYVAIRHNVLMSV